jgi:hypothetical protein
MQSSSSLIRRSRVATAFVYTGWIMFVPFISFLFLRIMSIKYSISSSLRSEGSWLWLNSGTPLTSLSLIFVFFQSVSRMGSGETPLDSYDFLSYFTSFTEMFSFFTMLNVWSKALDSSDAFATGKFLICWSIEPLGGSLRVSRLTRGSSEVPLTCYEVRGRFYPFNW